MNKNDRLLRDILSMAGRLGPVRTVQALGRSGDGEDPLGRLSRALSKAEGELRRILGVEAFDELLHVAASAFRMTREFSAAAYYFHRCGASAELDSLALLAYEFGDLDALLKLDEYARADGRKVLLGDRAALEAFVVGRAIPAVYIGGDQYRGFTTDDRLLERLRSAVAPRDLGELIRESVLCLVDSACADVAKMYVLAAKSGDPELSVKMSSAFSSVAARPRARAVELVEAAFPGRPVRVLRHGDTFNVRPGRRFIFRIDHDPGDSCILKELLPSPCEPPFEWYCGNEQDVLSALDVEGVPRFMGLVEMEGLRFLKIGRLRGERLGKILDGNRAIPLEEALSLCRQLARVLSDIHEAGTAHFDVCDDNILWDGERLSLVGFDKARFTGPSETHWVKPGVAHFVSPETAASFRAGQASDCFQMGLVFSRLLAGRHPFGPPAVPTPPGGDEKMQMLEYALPALHSPPALDEIPPVPGLDELLRRLLAAEPSRRIGAAEALDRLRRIAK